MDEDLESPPDRTNPPSAERRAIAATIAGFIASILAFVSSLVGVIADGIASISPLSFLASPTGITVVVGTIVSVAITVRAIGIVRRRRRYLVKFTVADIDDSELRGMIHSIATEMATFNRELARPNGGGR